MTSAWESTNLPGVFYAGTIMQIRDLKKTMSSVLHGFRFNTASLFNILSRRYMGIEWPCETFEAEPEPIAEKITDQVSSAAGLMHQPGFLGDCLVIDEETGKAFYHENIAVDYILDSHFSDHDHYYIITMEYGEFDGDIFNKEREPDAAKGYNDAYLHPRIRRMSRGRQLAEHHISESLENDWRPGKHPGDRPLIRSIDFAGQTDGSNYQQTHRKELLNFLKHQLAAGGAEPQPVSCRQADPADPEASDYSHCPSTNRSDTSAGQSLVDSSTGSSCPISRNA